MARPALSAPQLTQDALDEARPCLNPASIIWPLWRDPDAPTVTAQTSARKRRWEREDNFVIIGGR